MREEGSEETASRGEDGRAGREGRDHEIRAENGCGCGRGGGGGGLRWPRGGLGSGGAGPLSPCDPHIFFGSFA